MIQVSAERRELSPLSWDDLLATKRQLVAGGAAILDLGAGDIDLAPPAIAIEQLGVALQDPRMSKYGFQQGLPEFRRAAADWMGRRFGLAFDRNREILPLIGAKEGLSHLPFAVLRDGQRAIVPALGFHAYLGAATIAKARPYVAALRPENGYLVDVESLPRDVLEEAGLLYLNYPNNPTTAVATLDYLEKVVAVCRKYGIVIAYDNAYCDITFEGYQAPSIFQIPGARDVAVEFFSLSKSFSMTGWRLGWAAGRHELISALREVKAYIDAGPCLAIQHAGAAVLDRGEQLVTPMLAELAERHAAARGALSEVGLPTAPVLSTMYIWLAVPVAIPSIVFAKRLLTDEHVMTIPGAEFGDAGEGFFRLSMNIASSDVAEAVRRIGRQVQVMRAESVAVA